MPGGVTELTKDGFHVETGQGGLLVLLVQPAGGRVMPAADYARGYHLQQGERLGME